MNTISGFFNEYRFLSNFFECRIEYEGLIYSSAEAAYQAAKSASQQIRLEFTTMPPWQAKQAGRNIAVRPGFHNEKINIMENILRAKFTDPILAARLISTAPVPLIENNHCNDRFWGVSNGAGMNHLGLLLMKIRASLSTGPSVPAS